MLDLNQRGKWHFDLYCLSVKVEHKSKFWTLLLTSMLGIFIPLGTYAAASSEAEVGGEKVSSGKNGSYRIAAASKSKRDQMSAEQKRALRKKAME